MAPLVADDPDCCAGALVALRRVAVQLVCCPVVADGGGEASEEVGDRALMVCGTGGDDHAVGVGLEQRLDRSRALRITQRRAHFGCRSDRREPVHVAGNRGEFVGGDDLDRPPCVVVAAGGREHGGDAGEVGQSGG